MIANESTSDPFRKIGECLYRHTSSGAFYALLKLRGKQHRQKLDAHDEKEAKRLLADLRVKLSLQDEKLRGMTLAALCDRYLESCRSQSPKTQVKKVQIIKRLKETWLEGENAVLRKIRPSEIESWLGRQTEGLSASTFNEWLFTVRALFGMAVRDNVLFQNPVAHVEQKRRPTPLRATPTLEQVQAVLKLVRHEPLSDTGEASANLLEFMAFAGLGNAECHNLTWGDIDFEKGNITIFREKTKAGFSIPIFPQVRPILQRLRAATPNAPHEARVFEVASAKKSLSRACKKLKYPPFSPRSLRRFFVTRALELGLDVKVIAELQGHKDGGRLILSTYSHVRRPHLEMQVQKLMLP